MSLFGPRASLARGVLTDLALRESNSPLGRGLFHHLAMGDTLPGLLNAKGECRYQVDWLTFSSKFGLGPCNGLLLDIFKVLKVRAQVGRRFLFSPTPFAGCLRGLRNASVCLRRSSTGHGLQIRLEKVTCTCSSNGSHEGKGSVSCQCETDPPRNRTHKEMCFDCPISTAKGDNFGCAAEFAA